MPRSRSSLQFLRRQGLTPQAGRPAPRLAVDELLVHTLPLKTPKPLTSQLVSVEGEPPPDRGITHPWPDHEKDSP